MMVQNAISFRQLRALRAVAESGSITGAADILRLTPPGVHTQLKNLEQLMQVELLDRSRPGGMTLTAAGQLVLDADRRIESELDKLMRDIAALREGRIGEVRLGVVSTGKYFAPALVARLKEEAPGIGISLEIGNREHIISLLRSRGIHLAIMGRPPREPRVTSEIVGPHPHVLIARPDHPLAGLPDVSPDTLIEETFILREEGSGTRTLMNRYLDRIGGGRPFDAIVMGSNETIKQAVIAGLGIAMISEHTVTEELRNNRLVRLRSDGLPITRSWFLLHPSDITLSPAAAQIRDRISQMKGDFLPAL